MIVALYARFWGGIGGCEVLAANIARVCSDAGIELDVVASVIRDPRPDLATLPGVRLLQRSDRVADLGIVMGIPAIEQGVHARVRGYLPTGLLRPIDPLRVNYDWMLFESENPEHPNWESPKRYVLPSPILKPEIPPARLLHTALSIFNPYGMPDDDIKGVSEAIRFSRLRPLTWAWDDATYPHGYDSTVASMRRRGAMTEVYRASAEKLWKLRSSCAAYICFSHTEGFGWSIAEAAIAGAPIISRPVGIARELPGVVLVDGSVDSYVAAFDAVVAAGSPRCTYDLSRWSPEAFVAHLHTLAGV